MKIRTQLVLACFLLSILPLAGIVLYSYQSSRKALEGAYRNEAARMARQMDRRLGAIRNDLEQRLAELTALPLQSLPGGATTAGERGVVNNVMAALGDSARLVDSIEVQPLREEQIADAIRAGNEAAKKAAEREAAIAEAVEKKKAPKNKAFTSPVAPPAPSVPPTQVTVASPSDRQPVASPAPAPGETVIIDIAGIPLPQLTMSEEQRQRMREVGRLSSALSTSGGTMSNEEREALERQLAGLQEAFSKEHEANQLRFEKQLNDALRIRKERRNLERQQRHAAKGDDSITIINDEPMDVATVSPAAAPAPAAAPSPTVSPRPVADASPSIKRKLTTEEKAKLREHDKRATLLFGQRLNVPVRQDGKVVANVSAQVRADEVISRVLGAPGEDGEVAFAADREGTLYTRTGAERRTLDALGVSSAIRSGRAMPKPEDWIVAMSNDVQSGLRVGVARPIGNDLGELRRTAGWNFTAGIVLIIIAIIGIVPVANHLSRDVKLVTAGAERIAQGDLMTRVPVRSTNEFGQLASAFNKMAHDLSHQQQTIVEQERARKEQEIQQRMLALEYDRKSIELEEARRFQLSMLPKVVPAHDDFEIAVSTQTATEVGGDYYDFHLADSGVLSVTVGDATGHGAKAGTMVTVVKTLFSSYTDAQSPAAFLRQADEKIKRMDLGRMAMSLLLARFERGRLTIAAAGMPPTLVHRAATGNVEEIALEATPLGTLGNEFAERSLELAAGDTMLMLTDGFPELLDREGHQLGYGATLDAFAAAAKHATADAVIASIVESARQWHGDQAPNDDITFVVVRQRA
jgi:serine phosphatase RsbU (regulator of sigma subunit)